MILCTGFWLYIQASTNGVLSFGETFTSYVNTALPRTTTAVPLIAALWSDLDFTFSGSVYYRQVNDSGTLNEVRNMIVDMNPGLSGYQPTLAAIVTWFEAKEREDTSDFSVGLIAWHTPLKMCTPKSS